MNRKAVIAVIATGCLIAAASALVPGSRTPTADPKGEVGYAAYKPLYLKGRMMDGCFEEPMHCGLVVW